MDCHSPAADIYDFYLFIFVLVKGLKSDYTTPYLHKKYRDQEMSVNRKCKLTVLCICEYTVSLDYHCYQCVVIASNYQTLQNTVTWASHII